MMKVFSKIILVLGAIFLIIRIFFNNITKLDIVNRNAGIIPFVLLVLLIITELYIKIKKNEV